MRREKNAVIVAAPIVLSAKDETIAMIVPNVSALIVTTVLSVIHALTMTTAVADRAADIS